MGLLPRLDPSALVYLALPPMLLHAALSALATAGLGGGDAVAMEKPFGTDLLSARQLNEMIRTQLPSPTIFRVDHFLSNELVRRVISLRFLNRIFAPAWNAEHIEHVDISWLEDLTLEGRASYYDGAGAMKDMLQNHLMEALALVLMEQPARLDAQSFRAVRCPQGGGHPGGGDDAQHNGARQLHGRHDRDARGPLLRRRARRGPHPRHRNVRSPDPGCSQPTMVGRAIRHPVRQGIPAELGGDRGPLPPRAAVPHGPVAGVEPNVLRIGLTEPYVRLSTTLNGPDRTADQRQLETVSSRPPLTAYAHLVREMLHNDPMLFIRGDEAEESWRIVDPVMQAWSDGTVPMREYHAGGPPPTAVA